MHAAANLYCDDDILYCDDILHLYYFLSLHAARLFWLLKNCDRPIMRVEDSCRGGERESKCSTFCIVHARSYIVVFITGLDHLEVAESLEPQRSLL